MRTAERRRGCGICSTTVSQRVGVGRKHAVVSTTAINYWSTWRVWRSYEEPHLIHHLIHSALRVCRKIREEAQCVSYEETEFIIYSRLKYPVDTGYDALKKIRGCGSFIMTSKIIKLRSIDPSAAISKWRSSAAECESSACRLFGR